jgi:hypothetical protein
MYAKERKAIMERLCDYERLVVADVTISNLCSWIEKDIDTIRANIGIAEGDMPEAKFKRLFLNKSIDERHLLRICKSLHSTIKSRMYEASQ